MKKIKRKGVRVPTGATGIYHFVASAYCVAKEATYCAAFVYDPSTISPRSQDATGGLTIQNESVAPCRVGGWYRLGYVAFPDRGSWWVVL